MLYRTRFEHEMALLREDTPLPSQVTHYLAIKRNATLSGRQIAVHVPPAAVLSGVLDVIVYFHGHVADACNQDAAKFRQRGMEYYWQSCWFKNMRSELNDSRRAAILIAPAMHEFVGAKGSGAERYDDLDKAGAFDKFIDEVFTRIKAANDISPSAAIGNIVLAAHSGGGAPMRAVLKAANPKYRSKIRACWGFECLYPAPDVWLSWLNSDPQARFRHFRQIGAAPFEERVATLNGATNFVDTRTDECKSHCRLLRMYWSECIKLMPKTPGTKARY